VHTHMHIVLYEWGVAKRTSHDHGRKGKREAQVMITEERASVRQTFNS